MPKPGANIRLYTVALSCCRLGRKEEDRQLVEAGRAPERVVGRRARAPRCPRRAWSRAARTETARRTTRSEPAGRCRRRPPPAGAAPPPRRTDPRLAGRTSGAICVIHAKHSSPSRHASDTGVGPMPRPKISRSRSGPTTPARASAKVVPIVGCPAIGSSSAGREDPDAHVGVGPLGRQHERRLREVHLLGDRLHRLGRQPAAVEEHRELVAAEQTIGEDVEVNVAV